ncbi:MAG: beta-ketoacyl-ACP synthase II, partial [Solirubrobacterales bacterium]
YLQGGPRKISPFFVPGSIGNMVAGLASIHYGLKGPNLGTVSACSTGNHSIGEAARLIKYGDADVMVAGGAEACVSPLGVGGFAAARALSTRNDEPATASRPWDVGRDGFVLGEGAGVLVLESADLARRRGAPELGRIVGYGASSDAFHVTAPPPDGGGSIQALFAAFRQAGIEPGDVQYVNAHGTSTPLNDRTETLALKEVFDRHAYGIQVSSTKSVIGHLVGAAGAVEAIATLCALKTGTVAPTVGLEEPEEGLDLNFVPGDAQPLREPDPGRPPIAISNSFGFGGHNTVLVMEPGETPLGNGGPAGKGAESSNGSR